MTTNLAIVLAAKFDDRAVIRTLALWKAHKPNLNTADANPATVGYLIETYGVCA